MSGSALTLDSMHSRLIELASHTLPDGNPAFLFRGEAGVYPTTYSSLDRHYHDANLDQMVHDELDAITVFFMTRSFRNGRLPPKQAGAFAQHYGLPTQVFDFTASPNVAINFAANRASSRRPWPKLGMMGILDVAKAKRSGRAEIFDLRTFDNAIRPQRQAAFGLIYSGFVEDDHVDLKRAIVAEPIGLSWETFAHLPDDESYLFLTGCDDDLVDLKDDLEADIPQEIVDLYVEVHGPLSPMTAKFLAWIVPSPGRSPEENLSRWSGAPQDALH